LTINRIVIVGGPSRGKSTTAHELHTEHGWPVFCGDPASKVVYQKPYTTYLPEGLDFAGDMGAAAWVAERWFSMPGPWVCEGHVMARALRRWIGHADYPHDQDFPRYPCDRIIVLDREAHRETTRHQEAMHAGVMRVWYEISEYFAPITEWRE
jgi:hypothetical protein